MPNEPHPVSVAFWTYVIPMAATRALRIGIVLLVGFVALVILMFMGGFLASWVSTASLHGMRHFVVMIGVPASAILLSEMPLRDGITHRTLLYPLLGPVPRLTLVIVRTVITAAILALTSSLVLILIRVLLQEGFGFLPRELLSVTLASFAYVSLFGFVHLINRRGLIFGIVLFFVFDMPLGTVPFSLRNLSPSYHVGVIANQQENMQLPISFGLPDTSLLGSSLFLVAVAIVFIAAAAVAFTRKDLGELC